MDIKKGDLVYILKGELKRSEEKGSKEGSDTGAKKRVGRVLYVNKKRNTVLVEGFNMVKRHTRPNQKNQQGGIVTKESPIHRSKVALYSDELGGPTKISRKIVVEPDGRKSKVRICRKTGNEI
ncbi:MAG: 50S ribosomal protein L24 [Candidatus Zixiibacteriota bacterium]